DEHVPLDVVQDRPQATDIHGIVASAFIHRHGRTENGIFDVDRFAAAAELNVDAGERGDVEVADIEVVSDDFIQDWVGRIALEDDKVATVDILHPEDPVVVDEGFGTNGKIGNRGAPRAGPPRELIGDPERAVGIHIDAAEIAFTAVAVVVAAPLDEHRGLHRSSWVGWFAPGDPDG